ncbi:hypothetical protein EDB85DRAFT_2060614, partial [Lactarius pseudohatsudake]
PPPFPICAEGGRGHVAPDTSPPPLGRATPYARDGGTRGHAPPIPIAPGPSPLATPPIRTKMGHPSAHATRAEGGARGHDTPGRPVRAGTPHPGPPFLIRAEGGTSSARARGPRPPLPSCPCHPVRAERGHVRASRPIPWRPVRAGMGTRGQAVSSSRTGASPCARVHRARTPFARHSTT